MFRGGWRRFAVAVACGATVAAVPVEGQNPAQPACEFHVWPAAALESSSDGWVWNNVHNNDLRTKGGGPLPVAAMLSPARQLALLDALDLAALFGRPPARHILHESPLPPALPGEAAPRHAASLSPCYAELIVRHVTVSRAPFTATALHVIAQFRSFAVTDTPERTFTGFADAEIALPENRDRVSDEDAGLLEQVFVADIGDIARAALRPAERSKVKARKREDK